ncbi:MAG: hypothetical protein ACK46X_10660 [Candidatus Sericytochromatia bacterium]
MVPTRALRFGIALALSTSLTACAAQSGPAAIAPAPGAAFTASAARPTGKVQIDLGGLFSQLQGPSSRRTLAFGLNPAKYPITMLRVWAQAPGAAESTKIAEGTWNTSTASTNDKLALPSYTIVTDVPVGKNQIFTVEALNGTDEDAQVLLRMKAAANVEVAGVASIRLNFLEDAVARVIGELDAHNQGVSEGTTMTILETDDLVTPLRTYLTGLTGFNRTNNTYGSGRPAPQYVKTYVLSERLFTDRNLDWLASNSNFTAPLGEMSAELAQLLQPFDLSSAEVQRLQAGDLFGELPYEPNYDDYRISILAPTYSGWGAIDLQPFDNDGYYTPPSLPLGTYIAVAHVDNTQGGWSNTYREIRVTEMGVELTFGMFGP